MNRMLDYHECLKVDIQLDSYDQGKGEFGNRVAIDSKKLRSLTNWWMHFGGLILELQKLVVWVLSLTYSDSGCERNYNIFEFVILLFFSTYILILMLKNFDLILTYKFVSFIIYRFIPPREIRLNIKV